MSECSHPMILSSMCAVCGKIVEEEYDTKTFSTLTMTGGMVVKVSSNEALSIQQNKTAMLQKTRKLALVLDIDNTLVHATYAKGGAPLKHRQQDSDIFHLPIEEVDVEGRKRHLVIKKRPHLDFFLRDIAPFYQMTIYTAGTKRYAEAVTRVIDPTGQYIGSRIVARGEDGVTGVHDKSLEKIFLKDSSMAVILDDREDVWRGPQGEQLIVVRPYEFFYPGNPGSIAVQGCSEMGYVNNAPGVVTSPPPTDSNGNSPLVPVIALHQPRPGVTVRMASRTSPQYTEADDQLLRCLDILLGLHKSYYGRIDNLSSSSSPSMSRPTVAELLRQHRLLILKGCVIAIAADPKMPTALRHDFVHRMRHLARSLGASVVFDLHPKTTHVVTITDDIPLVVEALTKRSNDVWVLHVDWLHHCRWALAKAEESTFMLCPPPQGSAFPSPNYEVSELCSDGSLQNASTVDSSKKRARSMDDNAVTTAIDSSIRKESCRESSGVSTFLSPRVDSLENGDNKATEQDADGTQPLTKRLKTSQVKFSPSAESDEGTSLLEEVKRSARRQRILLQQRLKGHQPLKENDVDDYDSPDYERDSGMKCCMGPGDEDDEDVGSDGGDEDDFMVEGHNDDEQDSTDDKEDGSADSRGRDVTTLHTNADSEDYSIEFRDTDGADDDDDDEEEMALVQLLRSRAAQQQLSSDAPISDGLFSHQSDSESEGFSALGGQQWGWSRSGLRSVSNSSLALNGLDSNPNSGPSSPLSIQISSRAVAEKVLASIAPGPLSDMDEEEETSIR